MSVASPLYRAHSRDPFPTARPETSCVPARQDLRSEPDGFAPVLGSPRAGCCDAAVPPGDAPSPRVTGPHAPMGDLAAADLPLGLSGLLGSGMCPWGQRGR